MMNANGGQRGVSSGNLRRKLASGIISSIKNRDAFFRPRAQVCSSRPIDLTFPHPTNAAGRVDSNPPEPHFIIDIAACRHYRGSRAPGKFSACKDHRSALPSILPVTNSIRQDEFENFRASSG